jgi:hypothetical protein
MKKAFYITTIVNILLWAASPLPPSEKRTYADMKFSTTAPSDIYSTYLNGSKRQQG